MDQKRKFIKALKNLNRNKNTSWPKSTNGYAPHKPFLLLSILDGIGQGWIENEQIKLSQKLKDAFYIYWDAIIGKGRNTKVATPFEHLAGEPFHPYWKYLNNNHARLDNELFDQLRDESFRIEVRNIIIEEYFSSEAAFKISELSEMSSDAWKYSLEIDQMTKKPFSLYHDEKEKRTTREVSQQVREAGFSLKVRNLYNHSCAMCRSRVVTQFGKSLAEGAHIIPWSESYNDDPRNGLSLCKNHHWLFDRYLIALREDYTIEVSPYLQNNDEQSFQLESIINKEIILPKDPQYHPAKEAINDHRNRFEHYYID